MKYWFFAICILLQTLVFAEENVTQKNLGAITGVWQTTVNKHKFLVCWEGNRGSGNAYNEHNPHQLFELSATDKSDSLSWTLLDSSDEKMPLKPFLQITKIEANKIVADIQYGVKSSKSTVLKRVKTTNYNGECLFDDYKRNDNDVTMYQAFNMPRVKALKVWHSAPKTFMGKQYRINNAATQGKSKSVGEVSSLELSNGEQDLTAINKTLDRSFKDDQFSLATCGDMSISGGGDYHAHQRLRYWGSDWVSLSYHGDGYCGGAHPFFNAGTQTFNIETGKSEDVWQWFKLTTLDKNTEVAENAKQVCTLTKHKDNYLTQCLPPKLVKKIYQARTICDEKCPKPDDENSDFRGMADGNTYSIALSPNGVSFAPNLMEPARGMRTYYAHYVIPYAELKPLLSKKGKAEISKIILMSE